MQIKVFAEPLSLSIDRKNRQCIAVSVKNQILFRN